jgi:hypothetical protein
VRRGGFLANEQGTPRTMRRIHANGLRIVSRSAGAVLSRRS